MGGSSSSLAGTAPAPEPGPDDASTSRAVVEAAIVVFERLGIRRATMADVAAAAGVSRQSVYNHFGDKEQLIGAVISTAARDVNAEARRHVDLDLPSRELIVQAELALLVPARAYRLAGPFFAPDAVALTTQAIRHSARVAEVQREYWYPFLGVCAARRELRKGLVLDDAVAWLTAVHVELVAHPGQLGDGADLARLLSRHVAHPLLR